MAANVGPLTPIPPPQEPFVDRNGRITRTWYLYLKRVDEHIRDIERRLDDGSL